MAGPCMALSMLCASGFGLSCGVWRQLLMVLQVRLYKSGSI